MTQRSFNKRSLSIDEQIAFLRNKGLTINDAGYAKSCLDYIGYYRLKIYMRPFENNNKRFNNGTSFEDIIALYNFDRNLRAICINAMELIEVALRANVVNIMGGIGGPHFYYKESFFHQDIKNNKFKEQGKGKSMVSEIRRAAMDRNRHLSIAHYFENYCDPYLPPIWCIAEASSFGTLSRLFAGLEKQYRKKIAKKFFIPRDACVSWIRSLSTMRNMCAHYGRLWNADLIVNSPSAYAAIGIDGANNKKIYSRLAIMKTLLKNTHCHNQTLISEWDSSLKTLLNSKPGIVNLQSMMGFPNNWEQMTIWQ